MTQIIIVAAVAAVALAVGWFMQRQAPDAPTGVTEHKTPAQIDRNDFLRPDAEWLVAVFTSATCQTCAKVWTSAQLLESDVVAIQNIEVGADAPLHERYSITAVPSVVIADAQGVARGSFLGPPTSADLWAKLAELREQVDE